MGMRYVSVCEGGPEVSVLGLGCAAMMGSAGRKESVAALSAALDAGINFFDTARSYGYGQSEGLLGEFFAGRRDKVVLCTKFGILPAPRDWRQTVKPLVRGVLRLFPGLRGAARRQAGQMVSEGQFSVPVLRASLETSLRELRTEYVDLLLMHAAPVSVLAQADLLGELERLVREGKVRVAGISGELETIAATFAVRPRVLRTAQFACNPGNFAFLEDAASAGLFLVGNHPFGGPAGVAATRERIAGLRGDSRLSPELREKLDPADPNLLPDVVLNAILAAGVGAVIPAMLNPQHLTANCRAVSESRFDAGELTELRRVLGG
ncbi:MAG: aldo/keto reductase [Acidobacteriaceae bacterium]